MEESEQRYNDLLQQQLEQEQLRRIQVENQLSQTTEFSDSNKPNLIEFQLDLKEEIDRTYHLLSGHVIKRDKEGNEYWDEPDDDRLKVFSDYGVKRLMNIYQFYVNKNTLLSNYDDETIRWKMKDFGNELNDFIFTQYEHLFYYKKPEEIYEKLISIASKDLKEFYKNFPALFRKEQDGSLVLNEYLIYKKALEWSHQELQYRIRHYQIIVLALIDSVHSTYLRALHGEERDSLRKNWHIHENNSSNNQMPQQKFSLMNPSTWGGK